MNVPVSLYMLLYLPNNLTAVRAQVAAGQNRVVGIVSGVDAAVYEYKRSPDRSLLQQIRARVARADGLRIESPAAKL